MTFEWHLTDKLTLPYPPSYPRSFSSRTKQVLRQYYAPKLLKFLAISNGINLPDHGP